MESALELTKEDMNMETEGGALLFPNRVAWAKLHLKKAGLVGGERGLSKITPEGQKVLDMTPPPRIDGVFLKAIPQYKEWQNKSWNPRPDKDLDHNQSLDEMSVEDQIDSKYKELRKSLEFEVLEKIKAASPAFFEGLVVDLIKKIYRRDGKVVGRSGDGGIDGEISEDELGMSHIYLQAKRWNSTVPVEKIRGFVGALDLKGARAGIFITTSEFPPNAEEEIKKSSSSKRVRLIDGQELVHLMFTHNVGFNVKDTYTVKCIDEDFFP